LPFSADWSLEKPVLAEFQERLDHSSPALKWATVAGLFVSTIVLLVAWRRAVARSRAAEQETARVLERERLARDLHDDWQVSVLTIYTFLMNLMSILLAPTLAAGGFEGLSRTCPP
jgi:hypothetical protein